ncbi:hypothetical protein AAZX31_05G112400 [Glycine max]
MKDFWGLHMPLVCPDGTVVAYAWKRQLTGQVGASTIDRTRWKLGDLEKRTCQVLCRLRDEGDEAKETLKEVLSQNSSKQYDSDFANTCESFVEVLGNLTTIHSYFGLFSRKMIKMIWSLRRLSWS